MKFENPFQNKGLAGFGDSPVNFLYSLAATKKFGRSVGLKIENGAFAEAVRKSKLRRLLPKRADRKTLGDYAEAIIAYTWLNGLVTTDMCITVLKDEAENPGKCFYSSS